MLGSAFRNSAGRQIDTYLVQAAMLHTVLAAHGHTLELIAVEGDSTDDTVPQLDRMLSVLPGVRVTHNHGGPIFGSTEDPERFKALAGVGNAILAHVPDDAGAVIYVESDLIWETTTMLALLSCLNTGIDIVAPLVFAGEHFYDVFAYRGLDGERFSPFYPYHASMNGVLTEVSSVGSCLVMKATVARNVQIDEHVLVGFCAAARAKGFRIWVDSASKVRHPA